MSVTLTQVPQDNTTGENTDPLGYKTESDGVVFFHAPGKVTPFLDDASGVEHSKSNVATAPAAGVVEDNTASKKASPSDQSRS